MDNPIPHDKDGKVPIWVWGLIGVVVLLALFSHNASSTPATAATTVSNAPDAATTQLQEDQLQLQGAVAGKLLDIVGTEDIARINARSSEVYGAQSLAAIQAQSNASVASAYASTPQPAINVVVNKPTTVAAPIQRTLPTYRATTQRNLVASLNSFGGALSDGIQYAHSLL